MPGPQKPQDHPLLWPLRGISFFCRFQLPQQGNSICFSMQRKGLTDVSYAERYERAFLETFLRTKVKLTCWCSEKFISRFRRFENIAL
jgi:hypothetical protein